MKNSHSSHRPEPGSTVGADGAPGGGAGPPRRILIAGGGFAALEAMLALRALLADRVEITLVSPEPQLAYRPAATAEVFHLGPPRAYDLRAMCEDLRVTYRRDRLEAVAPRQRCVRLASFASVEYDALILALGARAANAIPGALTFRDQRDIPQVRRLLADLRRDALPRVVFAVPSGCTWPLALYELALMTSLYAEEHRMDIDVCIVTPERAPLAVFGGEASGVVARVLADHGVRFRGDSVAVRVTREGSLELHHGVSVAADRVLAVPQLRGPRITGVPGDWWGFAPTDARGRVEGMPDVYAVGDMTTYPIKQGGLAAQQADEVACTIAEAHGVADPRRPEGERVLRARLLGGERPLFLHVALDERGHPLATTLEHDDGAPATPGAQSGAASATSSAAEKVFGRHLTAYLERQKPLAAA